MGIPGAFRTTPISHQRKIFATNTPNELRKVMRNKLVFLKHLKIVYGQLDVSEITSFSRFVPVS